MRSALSALITAAALLPLPVAAHADTLDAFTVTGHGLELTFSLPSTPAVGGDFAKGLYFYLGGVSFVENGTTMTAASVFLYTKPDNGGFSLDDADGATIDGLDFLGPKLFAGTVKHPTFKEGMFKLTQNGCGVESEAVSADAALAPCRYRLAIDPAVAPTPTPEPGSLALLGTGAMGAVGVLRRRMSL